MKEAKKIGITALLPPELIYSCGAVPVDLNNFVPFSQHSPASKLCAWTASWRDAVISREVELDGLAIVAGGDCYIALVDGEKAAMSGVPAHFFFYPFHGEKVRMAEELEKLRDFLGGKEDIDGMEDIGGKGAVERKVQSTAFSMERISRLKDKGLEIDRLRSIGKLSPQEAFSLLISFTDLRSDPDCFEKEVDSALQRGSETGSSSSGSGTGGGSGEGGRVVGVGSEEKKEDGIRVALIGVPPIYHDFHEVCSSLGLRIVYDELPYEFIRLGGKTMDELAESYRNYTFARSIEYRLEFLEKELRKREVEGIVHYTQFACHHMLEDDIFRERFDYPVTTIQGDLPGRTSQQAVLRLEAFAERLRA